ncbi:hypothetical protein EDB83DRAFT_2419582 [Lactarius deliciosus]|nr:hypothetical protein EDB83DRAFT_2419582 [Lactarius deliciosus]
MCVSRVLLVVHSLVIRIGVVACHINYAPPYGEFSDATTFSTDATAAENVQIKPPKHSGEHWRKPIGSAAHSLSASMYIVVGPHNRFRVGSCVWLNVCYCQCLRLLAMACMCGGRIYNVGGSNKEMVIT